ANSGGNSVLVYLGLGNGQFDPTKHEFFTGTNPASVTIVGTPVGGVFAPDLDGNGVPDLVVPNEGSNDVTVLLGHGRDPTPHTLGKPTGWTLNTAQRLTVGAGPVSAVVTTVNGKQELVVANRQGNTVSVLPGQGTGFFDDTNPTVLNAGQNPNQVLVGNFG